LVVELVCAVVGVLQEEPSDVGVCDEDVVGADDWIGIFGVGVYGRAVVSIC
jgi:hypothetical protein